MDSGSLPSPGGRAVRESTLAEQCRMVDALQRALALTAGDVARFDTHISFVLVCARYAYKLKKAVDLGFLDFSTLAGRERYCAEELRLNRRLAPSLYLDVLPVTGSLDAPRLGGDGVPIDWAVRMRAFDQEGLWDRLAARRALRPDHVDDLVAQLVRFHRDAAIASGQHGSPTAVRAPMLDNLRTLARLAAAPDEQGQVDAIARWEATEFAALEPVFARRRADGRVREGHGDLHLGNVAQVDGRTTVFDCIEFSDEFRWIDVMSELAFISMDLLAHALPALAHRLVNAYLESSGDYGGARVLPYYRVHRALVRAKVAALAAPTRPQQAGGSRRYLGLASELARAGHAALVITHGLSGSGKTTATQSLLEAIGAMRIRADVERKRLYGLDPMQRSGSALNAGLYGEAATEATYAKLRELAVPALEAGTPVVLDATFLKRAQRDHARALAARHRVPFVVLDFDVDVPTLQARLGERTARGGDASEADAAVLQAQIAAHEPLADDERADVVACAAAGARDWTPLLERLAR